MYFPLFAAIIDKKRQRKGCLSMKRKWGAALAAGLLAASLLAGCAGGPAEDSSSAPAESQLTLENTGEKTEIVLGELEASPEKTEVLREIAEKYRADFPNTEIQIRSYQTEEEIAEALRLGEVDIAEVQGEDQPGWVSEGLLLNLYPYVQAWDESATFTQGSRQAVRSLGIERTYLIPNGFLQDVLYYRADWFDEYNEGLTSGTVQCRTWDEIAGGPEPEEGEDRLEGAVDKLGEKGRLALAGKDKLVDYFDTMVWSSISLGSVAHTSVAYFASGGGEDTVFTLEKTEDGVDQFLRVMQDAALPGSADWTEEQAVEAFINGEAGMLLADRFAVRALEEEMPEGSWAVQLFPRGRIGASALSCEYSGWGVSASVEAPGNAVHFLMFLSNADNNTHYAKVCGALPIHMEAADMEPALAEGDPALAAEMDMLHHTDWYQYCSEPVVYRAYTGWRERANEQLRQLVAGTLSKEELLEDMDGYWRAAYEEEGVLWKEIIES